MQSYPICIKRVSMTKGLYRDTRAELTLQLRQNDGSHFRCLPPTPRSPYLMPHDDAGSLLDNAAQPPVCLAFVLKFRTSELRTEGL